VPVVPAGDAGGSGTTCRWYRHQLPLLYRHHVPRHICNSGISWSSLPRPCYGKTPGEAPAPICQKIGQLFCMTEITIDTSTYERKTGRKPVGRAFWSFRLISDSVTVADKVISHAADMPKSTRMTHTGHRRPKSATGTPAVSGTLG